MSPEVIGQSPPIGLSVLIVGAGVGGLMAAMECWRRYIQLGSGSLRVLDILVIVLTSGFAEVAAFKSWKGLMAQLQRVHYFKLRYCKTLLRN